MCEWSSGRKLPSSSKEEKMYEAEAFPTLISTVIDAVMDESHPVLEMRCIHVVLV
jgi:hypothetical protein